MRKDIKWPDVPFGAWRLTPSFKLAEVTLLERLESFNEPHYIDDGGKLRSVGDLYLTRDAAIVGGHARLSAERQRIRKLQATLEKREAALNSASK